MGSKPSNNNVDLGQQAAQAAASQLQQQQQWQAEQAATNQASQVAQQQAQQVATQTTGQTTDMQNQYNALNAGQGVGVNATGGASGIKAANTLLTNSAGLSPADQKLQAAGLAASPTSLQSLMNKRAANSPAIAPSGTSLLSSSNVKLGGS